MHCVVGHIQKKRLLRVFAHEIGRALIDEIREIAFRLHRLLAVAQFIGSVEIVVAVVIGMAEQHAKILVEAAPRWIVLRLITEVPFAKGAGGIARRL